MAYRKLQFPANVQKGMQFDLHGYFDSCLGIQTISITKSSLTSAPQVKINTCIFPLETNFKIMLCTSQSKSPPPPQPGKGGDISGTKTDRRLSKLSRYEGSWTRIASTVFGVAKRLGQAQKAAKMAERNVSAF